jgi:hypothetical protein
VEWPKREKHWPSKCEALSLNLSAGKKKSKKKKTNAKDIMKKNKQKLRIPIVSSTAKRGPQNFWI